MQIVGQANKQVEVHQRLHESAGGVDACLCDHVVTLGFQLTAKQGCRPVDRCAMASTPLTVRKGWLGVFRAAFVEYRVLRELA